MRCAIKAKSEKPSKMAAGSKTIKSKIANKYIGESSIDSQHLAPWFKAWPPLVLRVQSAPKRLVYAYRTGICD